MRDDTELRVGEIYGYRHFSDDGGQLRGIVMSQYPFTPGVNVAKCVHKPYRKGHEVPAEGCSCGIYGFYSDDADVYSDDHDGPSGIIAAWGTVISGHLGFRAENAQIVALVRRRANPVHSMTICGYTLDLPFIIAAIFAGTAILFGGFLGLFDIFPLSPILFVFAAVGMVLGVSLDRSPRFQRWFAKQQGRSDERLARKYHVPLFETRDEAIAAFPMNDRPRFDDPEESSA